MSAVRLLVLGVVQMHKQTHGYSVYRDLLAWRIETWANVKPGSIYHALKQLEKQALLVAISTETSEEGPARTIYALSASGEREFQRLLETALVSLDIHEFGVGIAFMHELEHNQVMKLLMEREKQLEQVSRELQAMQKSYPYPSHLPHYKELLDQWITFFDSNANWTKGLRERQVTQEQKG